jgi:GT2 family glycosyltransferase
MQLSVIIVNYNVKYFLHLCLQSAESALHSIDAEVFVVDNNSSDGSVEMVQQQFPWVKVIANANNIGFGSANNQAIALAKGKYILLQNPDTVVAEDTYTRIIDFMDLKPDAGGLGVKMIDGVGKFLPESKRGLPTPEVAFYKIFGLSVLFPKSRIFGKYHLGFLDKQEIHCVDVLSGAFMLMRKDIIDKIGAFDEQFFMYGEDIDLSYRISEAGYKIYYYPGTTIIHYKGESTKKGSLNYVFVFYKAMIIFAKKHFASQKAALFSLLINTAVYIRAGIALVFRFFKLFTTPVIDALVMSGVMLLIIPLYEDFKFNGDSKFPDSLYTVNLPVYIFLWLAGLFFTNNYSKPFSKVTSLFYGMLLGTLSISVVYAFLGVEFRASRALILIGGLFNFFALFLVRWIWQMIKYRGFTMYNKNAHRIIAIGDANDIVALTRLLNKNTDAFIVNGYAGTLQEEELQDNFLGHYSRLPKILNLFPTEELIFVTEKISWKEVISTMENYKHKYTYKFFNTGAYFALGSNSKNAAGEVFTKAVNFSLNRAEAKYNKRFTDIVISFMMIPASLILFIRVNKKGNLFANIVGVLRGKKTWVGYADPSRDDLPKTRIGIVKTTYESDPDEIIIADKEYAKNYTSLKDVIILLKHVSHLGD